MMVVMVEVVVLWAALIIAVICSWAFVMEAVLWWKRQTVKRIIRKAHADYERFHKERVVGIDLRL